MKPAYCKHCLLTLQGHAAFARCPGGKTQFELLTPRFKLGEVARLQAPKHPVLGKASYSRFNGEYVTIVECLEQAPVTWPSMQIRETGIRYGVRFGDGEVLSYVDEEHLAHV